MADSNAAGWQHGWQYQMLGTTICHCQLKVLELIMTHMCRLKNQVYSYYIVKLLYIHCH